MVKPGMFISDRYEIIDKVGSGGMADVYKAKCHRLNRYVAIKILKSEFSSDATFVQKFRAEAQSVAGLSHPNIVSVYDVGEDDGLYYIVMELIEGITLKRFIERKKLLDVKEAVGITIQIAQGMEAAHNHHIVHRDIKPQNIIISREGKVKVADFGIAKAATSNTISQNAIGSVHYLSPEQARGGYSDERSDIYSLGVTLYEMLTGQVPFAGDNSVSVALLHIQSEATPVQVLNPDVPTSVDRIIQKCMQKKPERRYQSASELIKDLKRSILNPDGEYVNISNSAVISDSPTREISEDELSTIKSAAKSPVVHYENSRPEGKQPKIVKKEEEELDSMDSRLEKFLAVIAILFAIFMVCVIIYFIVPLIKGDSKTDNPETPTPIEESSSFFVDNGDVPTPTNPPATPTPYSEPDKMVRMPKVVGYKVEDAIKVLLTQSDEFNITYSEEEYSDDYEKGVVCNQYPPDGLDIGRNATISLTVSAGVELLDFAGVNGMTLEEASKAIRADGHSVKEEIHEFSDDVEAGCIIRTEPESGMVEKKTEFILYVSDGKQLVAVPSIIGMDKSSAKSAIKDAGLKVGNSSSEDSDEPKGNVIHQSYEAGTMVEPGTVIDFTVSSGKTKKAEEPEPVDDNPGNPDDSTPEPDEPGPDTGSDEPVG